MAARERRQPPLKAARYAVTNRTAERRAAIAGWLASRISPGYYVRLGYPPAPENAPRYGFGRPPHAGLESLLERHSADFAEELRRLVEYADDLARIPTESVDPLEPNWSAGFMFGLDGPSIYSFLRQRQPKRYVEVGSGNSTLFAARARRDGDLQTHFTSIDPMPRREIDDVCDTVIRQPVQNADLSIFSELEPGDVVFFDGTHHVFMNSDVTVFFLDVLPAIPDGVLVGVHDIYLPDDYRPEQAERFYSEQYLLAAYLLAACPWLRPVLPCWYVSTRAPLRAILEPLYRRPDLGMPTEPGVIFWASIER